MTLAALFERVDLPSKLRFRHPAVYFGGRCRPTAASYSPSAGEGTHTRAGGTRTRCADELARHQQSIGAQGEPLEELVSHATPAGPPPAEQESPTTLAHRPADLAMFFLPPEEASPPRCRHWE